MNLLGSRGIALGVVYCLDNHLEEAIKEVVDEHDRLVSACGIGEPVSLQKPTMIENEGFSFSPTFNPKDRYNSFLVFVDSENPWGTMINFGGPRSLSVTMGILWMVSDKVVSNLEVKKQLAVRAMQRCLYKYWHPVINGPMFQCATHSLSFAPTNYRFSSMRQSGGSSKSLRGIMSDTGDNIDGVTLGVSCVQRVYSPVIP